jgi:thymidylate synthase
MNFTNMIWQGLMQNILDNGQTANPRGKETKELLGCKTVVPMTHPVITIADRRLGYKFMAAEAAWILSGDNRVSTIAPYAKAISNFSDDGVYFFGAYGPPIKDQISHVVNALIDDVDSRQAVITIWRQNPRKSKDIPCTISCQFMIREGKLHCFMNMRSSDVWLGVPYDWFNFSALSAFVLLHLRDKGRVCELGNLHFYAASQHMYATNFDGAKKCMDSPIVCNYEPILLSQFEEPDDLVKHLWMCASGMAEFCNADWLKEIFTNEVEQA